ncbi:MAG: hypothetical protein K1X65_19980 [Caldilineales bacterium]|nr:hypothetical protein [Caldilineales bacterium]MCW5857081.1 hypothetical protein [Caldilineales bacterium]
MPTHTFTRWNYGSDIREAELRAQMRSEGLSPYTWSNGPNFVYSPHSHSYTKILYVVRGSITFHLPASNEEVVMQPGDRLNLSARVVHAATVGPEGVTCLEAVRRD